MKEKILRVIMVLFKKTAGKKPVFLVMHRCLNWQGWEFPKGEIEPEESLEGAAQRELFEETGLKNIRIIKRIEKKMSFFDRIRKKESEVFGFLVEALDNSPVSLEQNPVKEHDGFEWVDEKTVFRRLRFENARDFFKATLREMPSYEKG